MLRQRNERQKLGFYTYETSRKCPYQARGKAQV